ncbi:hypothetical protein [Pseudoxanthomonas mexicana]
MAGTQVTLKAALGAPVDVAVLGGDRVEGGLVFAGPFVMDTKDHAAQRNGISSMARWGGSMACRSDKRRESRRANYGCNISSVSPAEETGSTTSGDNLGEFPWRH